MSDVTLNVKGLSFIHPKESVRASRFIQNAKNSSDDRLKAVANLFFATLFNLGNTAYYTTSTVLGTVKRFATEGKKEAKDFLNAEGIKVLTTVIYTATTALLTIASLYDSNWALSHIDVNCAPRRNPPIQEEVVNPLRRCNYDQEVLALMQETPEGQLQLLKDVFQYNLENDDYSRGLIEEYRGAFTQEQEDALPILKFLLARIIFVQDWENAHELQHVIPVIEADLEAAKVNETIIKEKADKVEFAQQIRQANLLKVEEDRLILAEQAREYQEALEAEHIKAEQARLKETQEEALGVVETELGEVLEGLNARLKSFAVINADLTSNWQKTEPKAVGRFAMGAKIIFNFVSSRVKAVELGGIDLDKVAEKGAALEGLRREYPLADETCFEEIGAAEEEIQKVIEDINTLIDYAGLAKLKDDFPAEASEEQKTAHGQLVLDHIAAVQ